MSFLLAIDPGPEQSAYVLYDTQQKVPISWDKLPSSALCDFVGYLAARDGYSLAVEMIASYGMPVGAEVFETCVWIGRFEDRWHRGADFSKRSRRVFRRDVKHHLCNSAKATDANVRQALIDRYGPGKEKAIGLKATPGPLYGLTGDCWAALGVAVTATETEAA